MCLRFVAVNPRPKSAVSRATRACRTQAPARNNRPKNPVPWVSTGILHVGKSRFDRFSLIGDNTGVEIRHYLSESGHDHFQAWLDDLKDQRARVAIQRRVETG